jgi:hypothetical protein
LKRKGRSARASLNRSTSKKPTLFFAIDWNGYYRIEGATFVYTDRDTGHSRRYMTQASWACVDNRLGSAVHG